MASRRKNSGGGVFSKALWALVIASLIVSWYKTPIQGNPSNIMEWGQAKSAAVEAWVKSWTNGGNSLDIPKIGNGSNPTTGGGSATSGGITPNTSTVPPSETSSKLNALTVANAEKVSYKREEWKHWNTVSGCWDVREEVLNRDAVPGSVKYLDKDKNPTSSKAQACSIQSGQWVDYYSGKTFTDPTKLDIDHMIPLSYTAQHGGQGWDSNKKSEYANSMQTGHLVAVSASENRTKGDKGPSVWKPSDKGAWCQYATDWVSVAGSWNISIAQADKDALSSMLATCK